MNALIEGTVENRHEISMGIHATPQIRSMPKLLLNKKNYVLLLIFPQL